MTERLPPYTAESEASWQELVAMERDAADIAKEQVWQLRAGLQLLYADISQLRASAPPCAVPLTGMSLRDYLTAVMERISKLLAGEPAVIDLPGQHEGNPSS